MEAGTAIGIVSLGIQVCEGLLKYYHGVKGYENDIQETYKETKSLSKTFALLKTSLQAVASQTLATRAQECLVECQDGIQQLDAKLSRLHKEAPAGLRQKAQAGALRMIYPLQKKPLEELKTIAQNMTRHLNLAIQVITLDSGQSIERPTDEIKTTVESTEALTTKLQVTTLDTQQQVSTTAANVETLLSTEQSKELARILRWLSAPDPSVNHMQARDKHEPGTESGSSSAKLTRTGSLARHHFFGCMVKLAVARQSCVPPLSSTCPMRYLASMVWPLRTSTFPFRMRKSRTTQICCPP